MRDGVALFPHGPSFVAGDPESAGFYGLEMPDGFRWAKREAACHYRIGDEAAFTSPSLAIRAMGPNGARNNYLLVSVNDRPIGAELIAGYGTYFFPIPDGLLGKLSDDGTLTIRLFTMGEPATGTGDSRELAVAIYEIRVLDLAAGGFPERWEFEQQAKIFQPEVGEIARILGATEFSTGERVLDVGCGGGWTTAMLACLGPATVWGIDLYDYGGSSRQNFKTALVSRFARHADALRQIPRIAGLADRDELESAVQRCSFASMNAEELLWRDNSFDFVFSLNAFEHISRPDRALAEILRVLRPGGRALIQFSPLYYSDCGSHLPMTVGLNRPWAHLLMTPEQIKQAVIAQGGVPNEVDAILDSLNGWSSRQFRQLFETSGLKVLSNTAQTGFTIDGADASPEFATLLKRFPLEDLTTIGMLWYLERPRPS